MPTGPQGQKRPADVISNAVHVCKIAVGDIEETLEEQPRQPNKAKGGRAGGKARARAMTPERRKEIAQAAAAARWADAKA